MDPANLDALFRILSIIGGSGGILAMVLQARGSADTARVQGAAAIIEGYDKLNQQLQNRINCVEAQLVSLRQEMAALQAENETLRAQVHALEAERKELIDRIEELQRKMQGQE